MRRHHLALALLLSACAALVSWHWGSRSVGGADSYGYFSEADAWLSGELVVRHQFIEENHPPFSRWALAPLGWRAAVDGYAIVPMYSPGYPLMLAATKAVAGHRAMFVIVPLFTGLLVFVPYALGRRVGRPLVGLAAAGLVATSPTVLYMSMQPMSDIPSAALWGTTIVLTLCDSVWLSAAAGSVAAVAILVRPNLTFLALLCPMWLFVRDAVADGFRGIRRSRWLWFVLPALVGAVVNARINNWLFGSPWRSGYGDLSVYFSWDHFLPNLGRYAGYLASADTLLAFAALFMAVCAPVFMRWSTTSRRAAWLLAPAVLGVVVLYLCYLVFDAWWYLRFMLPVWPAVAFAGASGLAALWNRPAVWGRWAAAAVAVTMVAHGIWFASRHEAFDIGRTESRYPQVAVAVASATEPSAVIIASQHSGSMQYYGGRVTLRTDFLDEDALDVAVAWLREHGRHPYLLLDAHEVDAIRTKLAGRSRFAALDWAPRVSFFNGGTLLFDVDDVGQQFTLTRLGSYTARTTLPVPRPRW